MAGSSHATAFPAPTHGADARRSSGKTRSEEHTSELQSHVNLVCRLLLEKKKTIQHSLTQASNYHPESYSNDQSYSCLRLYSEQSQHHHLGRHLSSLFCQSSSHHHSH